MENKEYKKAYRRAKRKAVRPWKGLTVLTGVLTAVVLAATLVVQAFDNTMCIFAGGTFMKLEKEDENAQYYRSDFASAEEKQKYGEALCEQVEAEGAVLLKNENHALPLESGFRVSCFSSSSVNLVYGGTGSGNIDSENAPTLKSALEEAGFLVNGLLWDFYSEGAGSSYVRDPGGLFQGKGASLSEVPWEVYTEDVRDSVKEYSDAAIVVFSRVGGEGSDLTSQEENYLELNKEERELLKNLSRMKEEGTVERIIVLINSANTLQMDWLLDEAYEVDACLWIGDVGVSGINAVADILAGNITPSGRLADTWCYDTYSSPAMANFISSVYEGAENLNARMKNYVVYQEGIYVGYRYYETRYEDYVMGTGNAGDYTYDAQVAYPFGYGQSYTQFAYSDMSVRYEEAFDQFVVEVKVTNTGDTFAGKHTVQVYSQSPYTDYDKDNRIEKASVTLCGFGKTAVLNPGESEKVVIRVDKRDLASYDAYGEKTYILEQGDYYLTIGENAHAAVNNVLAVKGYTRENTDGRMDMNGDASMVYQWNQPVFDSKSYAVTAVTGYPIENQFESADLNYYEDGVQGIRYVSRSDWMETFPTEPVALRLTEQLEQDLQFLQYDSQDYQKPDMPAMNVKNGLNAYDMIGLDYDDLLWEDLLDELSFEEMESLIGDSFHWTMPVESINLPATRDENGPQGLTASLIRSSAISATGFTSEDVMAATFNVELMEQIGYVIGEDCLWAGVSHLYGPGNNIHRTPYGGRNFEYFSEDGFLAGEMSAVEIAAIQSKGVNVLIKHFALNDCEKNRSGLATWANEQSIREIYLKAFQAPVEEAGANGVMTAYNRIGAVWAGGSYELVTNVLRNEWGCKGMVITDNAHAGYMNGPDGIMSGGSTFDVMTKDSYQKYKEDAVIVTAMREACHRNIYAIVNSCAMNGIGKDTTVKLVTAWPVTAMRVAAAVMSILFAGSLWMYVLKKRNFKKEWNTKGEIL